MKRINFISVLFLWRAVKTCIGCENLSDFQGRAGVFICSSFIKSWFIKRLESGPNTKHKVANSCLLGNLKAIKCQANSF